MRHLGVFAYGHPNDPYKIQLGRRGRSVQIESCSLGRSSSQAWRYAILRPLPPSPGSSGARLGRYVFAGRSGRFGQRRSATGSKALESRIPLRSSLSSRISSLSDLTIFQSPQCAGLLLKFSRKRLQRLSASYNMLLHVKCSKSDRLLGIPSALPLQLIWITGGQLFKLLEE